MTLVTELFSELNPSYLKGKPCFYLRDRVRYPPICQEFKFDCHGCGIYQELQKGDTPEVRKILEQYNHF